MGQELGTIK